mmetsp:Transcript_86515/g.225725  ORF Transcript_86515/g.225725 Transcript_86515/m.225725 type:complete len:229 (+) Transcript_86515:250-936(+)
MAKSCFSLSNGSRDSESASMALRVPSISSTYAALPRSFSTASASASEPVSSWKALANSVTFRASAWWPPPAPLGAPATRARFARLGSGSWKRSRTRAGGSLSSRSAFEMSTFCLSNRSGLQPPAPASSAFGVAFGASGRGAESEAPSTFASAGAAGSSLSTLFSAFLRTPTEGTVVLTFRCCCTSLRSDSPSTASRLQPDAATSSTAASTISRSSAGGSRNQRPLCSA